jgi:hypothetical protein
MSESTIVTSPFSASILPDTLVTGGEFAADVMVIDVKAITVPMNWSPSIVAEDPTAQYTF